MNDIKILFWNTIKKLRKEKWISQEKLALLAWLHRTYISDIERGVINVSLENIQKLSLALDVTVSELFK